MKHWLLIVRRELQLSLFKKGYFFNSLSLLIILSFTLSVNLTFANKAHSAIMILLVSYIITCTLSSSSIFQDDYLDSSLEQLLISGHSSLFIVTAKIVAYWIVLTSTLLINSCIYAAIFDINFYNLSYIALVFICNSLVITCITAFSSALVLKLDKNTIVKFIVTMPLTVVTLLYSATILSTSATNNISIIDLKILIGLTLITVPILVSACSYLLRTI